VSWAKVELGEVCQLINGDRGKNYPSKDALYSEGIPFINAGNLQEDLSIQCSGVNYITQDRFNLLSNGKVNHGDILFCLRGSLGKFAIVGKDISQGAIASSLVIIRPKAQLHSSFLKNYLRSTLCRDEIAKFENGAAQPNLSAKDLKKFEIPLPPLTEQKRIAAILDKADAIRRKRQQAIQLADEFLRAVFLDMFGDPVANHKGFPLGTIRDLVESANYGSSAKASEAGGDYPILRMGNITYEGAIDMTDLKYIDLSDKEKPKYLAVKGDLLFNRTNSKELVGKTAVYDRDDPVAIAGYLIRVRTNDKGNSHYISGYMNSAHGKATLQNMSKSIVGMANINAQEMQDIPIIIPPVSLQNRYKDIVVSTKEKLAEHQKALNANNELFNALSQKAFSGQLS
jgi:type I restriction enzyme S subunit